MQWKETYFTNQTTNAFRWWFAYWLSFCGKRWKLQCEMLHFTDISIDFYPKEAMEFTATVTLFKWEVA